jgi:1,4-alpha-glucan branching enzyme
LPPTAFVSFLQCHDQIGNRAFGERIANFSNPAALPAAISCILLSPQIPMLFMGEEFSASSPFLFFCDFGGELANAVREGRKREFKSFDRFGAPETDIPDPGGKSSYLQSRLSWNEMDNPFHAEWRNFYRGLLRIRAKKIVPHLQPRGRHAAHFAVTDSGGLTVEWQLGQVRLALQANFSSAPLNLDPLPGEILFRSEKATGKLLPAWGVSWSLQS